MNQTGGDTKKVLFRGVIVPFYHLGIYAMIILIYRGKGSTGASDAFSLVNFRQ